MDVLPICKISTSSRQRDEFLAWQPEKSGRFMVKSAYHLAMQNHEESFSSGASGAQPDGTSDLESYLANKRPAKSETNGLEGSDGCSQYIEMHAI